MVPVNLEKSDWLSTHKWLHLTEGNLVEIVIFNTFKISFLFTQCLILLETTEWLHHSNDSSYTKSRLRCSISITVTSPNIARPLTLRTSPSDYAKFNCYLISGCFSKEKNNNKFSLYVSTAG